MKPLSLNVPRDSVKKLWFERVIPGSLAKKVGLLPMDQLIAVEGIGIEKVEEIHHAFAEKGWRNDITFTRLPRWVKEVINMTLPLLDE
jgi:hypothetical protein